jgi:tetratricopeptide (TPR) repeat protein
MRNQREEQQRLDAIEELITLRRWPEAGGLLQQQLSQPARTPQMRAQALIFLASTLVRYHRFDEAIAVHTELLDSGLLDEGSMYGVRLGRAMAMLREDSLVDADQAMSEVRRSPAAPNSAGYALVELYRDVKTGHPAEAVEIFQAKRDLFRQQLGHRVADAWALVARAYDLLGRSDEAATAYHNATLLAPVAELQRRYPEVTALEGKYPVATAPQGWAT